MDKKVIILGILVFSFLPIWKSGLRRNMTMWDFVLGHTIYSRYETLYVPKEYLTSELPPRGPNKQITKSVNYT